MTNTLLNIDIEKVKAALAGKELRRFVLYTKQDYVVKAYHDYIMSRLDAFGRGEIKKLMIFAPPQHGKTEIASRRFPAYFLGHNPSTKVAVASYSATIAHEIGRDIKNIINSYEYKQIFPKVTAGKSNNIDASMSDASHYYHISSTGEKNNGFVYTVGRGGSITSKTVDLGIIDDILKGREEASSLNVKKKMWQWFKDDWRTRMHNDSRELIMTTRWAEDDLAGRLLKEEADQWEVIIFPAIKTEDYCAYDNRQPGEALFPEKHSLERILQIKRTNETSFDSLYQQNPKPNSKLLVHPDFVKVKEFPVNLINKWVIGIDYGYNDHTAVTAIGCHENKRYWKKLLYKPGKDIISESKVPIPEGGGDKAEEKKAEVIVDAIYAVIAAAGLTKSFCFSEHDPVKIRKLRAKGLLIYLANKSVSEGLEKINEFENYYLEDDFEFYNEVSQYQFKSIGELILDEPVDGNDHIMNSGRYGVYTDYILNMGR